MTEQEYFENAFQQAQISLQLTLNNSTEQRQFDLFRIHSALIQITNNNDEDMRNWMHTENSFFQQIPATLIQGNNMDVVVSYLELLALKHLKKVG